MPRLVRAPIVAVLVAALVGPSLGAIQEWYKQTDPPPSPKCNSCTCLADNWGFERCPPPITIAERYWSNGLNAGTNGYDLTSTVTGLVPGVTYTVRMYAFRSDLDSSKDPPYPMATQRQSMSASSSLGASITAIVNPADIGGRATGICATRQRTQYLRERPRSRW